MGKDIVSRLREFKENEAKSCSMDFGCITPEYVYRMWGGTVPMEEIEKAMLSKSLVKTSVYSEKIIWARCFDAYTIADFKHTSLYDSLHGWESEKGLSLFRRG